MAKDLAAAAKAKNIKYFLVSFVDLLGQLRAKLVPATLLARTASTRLGNLVVRTASPFSRIFSWEICPVR